MVHYRGMGEVLAPAQMSADSMLISGPNGPGFGVDDPRLLSSPELTPYQPGSIEDYSFAPDMIAPPDDPFLG